MRAVFLPCAAAALSPPRCPPLRRRRRRAPSAGDRVVPEPGLLVLPARQRQSFRLGGARRRAGAQFRRRLLGFARLEGHVRQARRSPPASGPTPARSVTAKSIRRRRSSTAAPTRPAPTRAELQAAGRARRIAAPAAPTLSIEAGRALIGAGEAPPGGAEVWLARYDPSDPRGRSQARRERRPPAASRPYRRRSRPPRPVARRSRALRLCPPRPTRGSSTPCSSSRPGPGRSSPPSKNAPSDAGPTAASCHGAAVLHMFLSAHGRRRGRARGEHGRAGRHGGVRGRRGAPGRRPGAGRHGAVAFTIVGLGDKAVAESRERVRAALVASGLALPARRITVNLAPADLPKEGSHYDLPIALGVMAAIGAIPADALDGYAVIGELALDGDDQRRSPACCRRRSPPTRAASAWSARPPAGRRRPGPRPSSRSSRRAR